MMKLATYYDDKAALTLSSLYGSNGTSIAASVFIWASEISITLEGPSATASGVVHLGYFPLATL